MTGSFSRGLTLSATALLLWGCGTFPLPRTYVLGDLARPTPGVIDEAGLTYIELKTVRVPDYLDTTDIVRRTASNEVTASATGQWGERLDDVGSQITRSLNQGRPPGQDAHSGVLAAVGDKVRPLQHWLRLRWF